MLEVKDFILQRQGRNLNAPVSLSIAPGKLLWLKGENGVGKSTLLKTLVGLLKNASGKLEWAAPKPQTFYLAHELAIKPQLTTSEHCRWHPAVGKVNEAQLKEALSTVAIPMHKSCAQLSRGQQQRLAIACALLSKAQLWLLDEPLTALDTESQTIIKDCLQQHIQQNGAAIIASHSSLEDLATETILLEAA